MLLGDIRLYRLYGSKACGDQAPFPQFSSLFENWPRNLLVIRHILVFNEFASLIPYPPSRDSFKSLTSSTPLGSA